MKKIILLCCGILMSAQAFSQSADFGLTAGYLNLNVSSSYEGLNASVSESGFYLGAFADFDLSSDFSIQPGVNYGKVQDSEGILFIPVLAKYYVGDSAFNLLAGPQASIILEDTGDEINAFGLDVTFGAGFDITEDFQLQARYSLELTNRIGDVQGMPSDVKSRVNSLTIGLGYKF